MAYELKYITEFEVGQKGTFTKTITEADVLMFGAVSGDLNPVHFDHEYAKTTMFKKTIAHGGICVGLLSAAGAQFTGQGSIFVKCEYFFAAPVFIGDTITATMEIADINYEKKNMHFHAYCKNQNGETVLDGKATVKFIV
jgi:3-hydroxybutyryl-CoA dehydratase